jgi:hypothetical protein
MGYDNISWDCRRIGGVSVKGYFHACSLTGGGRVAWIVRVVKTGAEGEGHCTDVMEIVRPADLGDIADLGLTLADAKRLLAGLQQVIVAGQSGDHAARRPACPRCGVVCHVKDYRERGVATLFGRVTVRFPRFRCAACGGIAAGIGWPSRCQSTPELDQLQAHLCALMTYRTAADVLEQMFPVDAGNDPETLRRHTLRTGEALQYCPAARPETAAWAIMVSLDSTFIRSCEDGERHLEVRVGNVETPSGGRHTEASFSFARNSAEIAAEAALDGLYVYRRAMMHGPTRNHRPFPTHIIWDRRVRPTHAI